jgi:hypothetical protein
MTRRPVLYQAPEDVSEHTKVRLKDERVGVVFCELSRDYTSIQTQRGGFYLVCKNVDLTQIDELEFRRKWR